MERKDHLTAEDAIAQIRFLTYALASRIQWRAGMVRHPDEYLHEALNELEAAIPKVREDMDL